MQGVTGAGTVVVGKEKAVRVRHGFPEASQMRCQNHPRIMPAWHAAAQVYMCVCVCVCVCVCASQGADFQNS